MYRAIIAARVRTTFERINQGDYMYMVDGLAPVFEYRFHGEHALGGRRTGRASMIRWWERVTHLMPGVRFEVRDVITQGPPWLTRVAVRSRVSGSLADGSVYENTVLQFITLSWGKVTAVETMEDLRLLEQALARLARSGREEALAPPICDE